MSNLPTVRQLECFVAVTKTLNFRLAAELCLITQPALSAQIQQLESSLDVRLFERTTRSVMPTAAGVAMADKARSILADVHELGEHARSFRQPLAGSLRLGVIPTVAPYTLPTALAEVQRRHPALRLLLREGQTHELVRLLTDGSLDVLLLALETDLGDVETLPLFTDRFVLAVPPSHRLARRKRVSMKDLADEQVLLLEDGHCLREQSLPICEQAGACEVGDFRASSLNTLAQMVAAGVGITLLPDMSVRDVGGTRAGLVTIPFGARGPARTIGLAWRRSSVRGDEFRLLAEALQQGRRRGR